MIGGSTVLIAIRSFDINLPYAFDAVVPETIISILIMLAMQWRSKNKRKLTKNQ